MFYYHLQHLEILLKCVKSAGFNRIFLQYFYNTIFSKVLIIYVFLKIFQKVKIVMLR